jgi:hypothetical protein
LEGKIKDKDTSKDRHRQTSEYGKYDIVIEATETSLETGCAQLPYI